MISSEDLENAERYYDENEECFTCTGKGELYFYKWSNPTIVRLCKDCKNLNNKILAAKTTTKTKKTKCTRHFLP